MKPLAILDFIIARLAEPSTWAAGSVGAVAIHSFLPGAIGDATLGVLAAVGALGGAIMAEKGKAP